MFMSKEQTQSNNSTLFPEKKKTMYESVFGKSEKSLSETVKDTAQSAVQTVKTTAQNVGETVGILPKKPWYQFWGGKKGGYKYKSKSKRKLTSKGGKGKKNKPRQSKAGK